MRSKRLILAFTLCGVLMCSMCLNSCSGNDLDDTKDTENSQESTAVEVMEATTGTIQNEYTYSGSVRPVEEVNVVGMVAGLVESVNVSVGDQVEEDQVLCQLDTEDIENNLNLLNAQLEVAKAGVRSAQTGVELVDGASMQVQLVSAKAGMDQAKLSYDNLKTTYENTLQLYEAGVVSKNDLDQAELGLKNAEIAYEQAKQSYELMSNQMISENLRQAQDGLATAQANQKSVEAQIASAEKSLDDATIKSPISGTVTSCTVTEGGLYSQSAGPAFVISDTSKVDILVGVTEEIINEIQVGDTATVKVAAVSDENFEATVEEVSPAAGQTGTYQVKLVLENSDGKLKSGMFGEVKFISQRSEGAIVLPRDAVLSADGEYYVFVEENGKAKKITVTLGIDSGEQVEIVEGLSEGSRVIIKGQSFLNDGDLVTVSGTDAKGE